MTAEEKERLELSVDEAVWAYRAKTAECRLHRMEWICVGLCVAIVAVVIVCSYLVEKGC